MTASAAVMGLAGVGGSFLPDEILDALGVDGGGRMPFIVQLLAALWLAAAMTNWMARGNAIGGIYGRPIAIGNLTHFSIGALTLAKLATVGAGGLVVAAAGVYAAFAVGFAVVVFSAGPVAGSPRTPTNLPPPPIR